ncbi:MAG: glutaredoxin family protein [Verrucomicrobiia bacterium]
MLGIVEMVLYVKPWCPWCVTAREDLKRRGFVFREVDVTSSESAFQEMRRLSGQSRAPVLLAGELVLADFGPPELQEFLVRHQIAP